MMRKIGRSMYQGREAVKESLRLRLPTSAEMGEHRMPPSTAKGSGRDAWQQASLGQSACWFSAQANLGNVTKRPKAIATWEGNVREQHGPLQGSWAGTQSSSPQMPASPGKLKKGDFKVHSKSIDKIFKG